MAAELISSTPPKAEKGDPRDEVFEAIMKGEMAQFHLQSIRGKFADKLEGEEPDYISLTPSPPAPVVRDDTETAEMLEWRRGQGTHSEPETH
ncbi:hypothetical protein JXD20_02465 [Candidatus Peregrinibacteria bacterium]|nr:hypothetical protein [Candidatus Peregrinibacteria bacterium]